MLPWEIAPVASESGINVQSCNDKHIKIDRENEKVIAAMPAVPFRHCCKQATYVPRCLLVSSSAHLESSRQLPKAMLQIEPGPTSQPILLTAAWAWQHPKRPLVVFRHQAETGFWLCIQVLWCYACFGHEARFDAASVWEPKMFCNNTQQRQVETWWQAWVCTLWETASHEEIMTSCYLPTKHECDAHEKAADHQVQGTDVDAKTLQYYRAASAKRENFGRHACDPYGGHGPERMEAAFPQQIGDHVNWRSSCHGVNMYSADIEQISSSDADGDAPENFRLEHPPPSEHQQPASGCPAQFPLIEQQRAACPSSGQARCRPQPGPGKQPSAHACLMLTLLVHAGVMTMPACMHACMPDDAA